MIRGYNERTFLAWIRTSIAVIALGFVVEKLNLFALTAVSAPSLNEASRSQLEKLSGPLGRGAGHAFIVVGILFIVVATFRFVRTGRLLDDSSTHSPCILPDLIFAVIISSLLIALSTYLLRFEAWWRLPPEFGCFVVGAKAAGRHSRQALQRDGEQSPLARSHAALSDDASSRRKWALLRSRRLWKVT